MIRKTIENYPFTCGIAFGLSLAAGVVFVATAIVFGGAT